MDNFFSDYNERQLEAITASEKKICVFAGPGTGKTKTLVGKYIFLLKELNINPENILCLTFTKKAAEEMENRVKAVCGDNRSKYIGTIHSVANKILSIDVFHLGYPDKYSILAEEEQRTLINDIMKDLHLYDEFNITFRDVLLHIAEQKNTINYIDLILDRDLLEKKIAREENKKELAFLNYLLFQAKNYYLDYFDLITFTIRLFSKNIDILEKWSSKFQYILVDEFQDLTENEFKFISMLSKCHGRIFGVGDPDQSIYGFRGSNVEIFNKFYESADSKFEFDQNYRSSQEIIDLSHDLIKANDDRVVDVNLICRKKSGTKVRIIHTADRRSEAIYIVNKLKELISKGVKRNECAILYRNNLCSLVFEEQLLLEKIPYKVYSNNEFFNCDEIKTCVSYIKFLIFHDDASFINIYRKPIRYISNLMLNKIKELSKKYKVSFWEVIKDNYKDPVFLGRLDSFVEFVTKFETLDPNENFEEWCINAFKDSGFLKYIFSIGDEDKANRIKEFIDMIHSFEPTDPDRNIAEEFLSSIALLNDGDVKEEDDKIQLMTIHCSKGAEFRYVFLVDFNDGFIPSSKIEKKKDILEERRICYVAFTRAKDQLFIIESEGDDGNNLSSPFKENLSPDNYVLEKYLIKEKNYSDKLVVGAHVKSKFYGKGVISLIDASKGTCIVKFDDYYNEKEVPLNTVIHDRMYKELSFPIDEDIVGRIKAEIPQFYGAGDIVLHKYYGAGIITRVVDQEAAYIQFKDISSMFDLKSNALIKRSDYIKFIDEKKKNKMN